MKYVIFYCLEYAAKKRRDEIYKITKMNGFYDKKKWYDMEWLEEIIDKCKVIILYTLVIYTENDSMIE